MIKGVRPLLALLALVLCTNAWAQTTTFPDNGLDMPLATSQPAPLPQPAATPPSATQPETPVTATTDAPATTYRTPEESEPTTIIFDLYVAGDFRGDVLTTYTATWAQLEDPDNLMGYLPEVEDKAAVVNLMKGKVEGLTRTIPHVGTLKIEPDSFRVTFEPAPDVLKIKHRDRTSLLAPDPNFTLNQTFRINTVNSFGNSSQNTTLSHSTTPSWGRNRIDWNGSYNDTTNTYTFQKLAGVWESHTSEASLGLLSTEGQSFAVSRQIMGVKFGTNESTLFDNPQDISTQLDVYVPSRARINVYRDNDLIYTRIHDFGLQQLDTSSMPSGSYEVRIEVIEESGKTTTQTRLFTKTGRLTPPERWVWNITGGLLRDGISLGEAWTTQASLKRRINNKFDIGISAYGGEDLWIFQPSWNYYDGDLELHQNWSFSTEGDIAADLTGVLLTNNGNWTGRIASTLVGHNKNLSNSPDLFQPLVSERTLMRLGYSLNIGRMTVSMQGFYNAGSDDDQWGYGPKLRYILYNDMTHNLEASTDYTKTQDGDAYSAMLRYTYRPSSGWSTITSLEQQHTPDTRNTGLRNSISYSNRDHGGPGLEANLSVSGARQNAVNTASLDGDVLYVNNTASVRVTGLHTRQKGASNTSMGLEAATTLSYGQNSLMVTAPPNSDVAYILELTGNATGTPMIVYNNNQRLQTIHVGEKAQIYLQPHKNNSITIGPGKDDALIVYDEAPDEFNLNPGNVRHHTIRVEKVLLLFGRLVDVNGTPIAWKRIQGGLKTVLTDQLGNFQLEYTRTDHPFINGDQSCTVALPSQKIDDSYNFVGDILCL